MFVAILCISCLFIGTAFATTLEPGFTAPIENVTAPLGREAILACTVHNLNTYKVAWLRVDTQTILTIHTHVISRSRRVGVTHSDHRVWFLHIRELRETDRGWYMCQINTDPMKSQRGYLHVTVPPDILDEGTSGDVAVREGAVSSLTCAVSGSPTPSLIWRREGSKPIRLANGTEVTSVEGSVLNLSAVSREHAGGYLCIASNGVPPTVSKRITLTVEFPPVVTIRNHVVGAPLGTDLMLQCKIEAYPKPVVYWTKDNVEIFGPDSEPVKLESLYRGTMRLPVRITSESDYGSYRCVAKNSLGDAEGTIKVYQISAVDFDRKSDAQRQNVVASGSTLFGSQDFRFLQNYNNFATRLESFKYISLVLLVTLYFLL